MTKSNSAVSPPEDRDGFRFRGGAAVIDLPATLQGRLKSTPRELLGEPKDLDRWLMSARLVGSSPGATATDLETAKTLREAVFVLAGDMAGTGLDVGARDTLNTIAGAPAAAPLLGARGELSLDGSVAQLLSFLAREAVRLFGGEDSTKIRQCQSPTCTIFFIDASRSSDRRWCSMSACGNKAKVAAFRQRGRAAGTDAP